MERDLFYHIKRLNGRYKKNDCNGADEIGEDKNYICFVGEIPILFSTPHSVKQVRDGKGKGEDILTGAIVSYICTTYKTFGMI